MTSDVVERLVEAYERELGLYNRLLVLAEESATQAEAPRSVERVLGVLREKGRLLAEIGEVESTLAPTKALWAAAKADAPAGAVASLNAVLDRIARTIGAILAIEESGSRRFAAREALGPASGRLVGAARAADYQIDGTADPCLSVQG